MNPIRPRLGVTVSASVDDELEARARRRAAQWGIPFVARAPKSALEPLVGVAAEALIVFERAGVSLAFLGGRVRWSPGMALLRIQRLDAGVDEDLMVRLGALGPKDAVLDCTLGLGQDSLVAARAVGPSGKVVGVESSAAICRLVEEGLSRLREPKSCPIEVRHGFYEETLRALPDRSFDVVLFDPMFERPRRSQPAFEVLRRFGDRSPLDRAQVEQARRVARRVVLVKGSRYSRDLKKLGLDPVSASPYRTVLWAVVPALGSRQSLDEPRGGPSLPTGESLPDKAPACSCGIMSRGERKYCMGE